MQRVNSIFAITVLVVMSLMVIAALIDMRRAGSLDDLDADSIKKAVNG